MELGAVYPVSGYLRAGRSTLFGIFSCIISSHIQFIITFKTHLHLTFALQPPVKMKFTTSIALLGAVAATNAQTIIGLGPTRGPNTLVLKQINGVPNNECLTFTNDGIIVNAACALTHADRQITPGKILGTDILIIQRGWQQQFRPDLVGKTACVAFNGTTFRAEDCSRRDLLFARFDVGNGRVVANGEPSCISGYDNAARIKVDVDGRSCSQFTITAVTPTRMPADKKMFNKYVGKALGTFPKIREGKEKPNKRHGIGGPVWSPPVPVPVPVRGESLKQEELSDSDSRSKTPESSSDGKNVGPQLDTLCEQCSRLNLSRHKFSARTTLTTTTHTNTTTVLPGDFDSIGFDATHLGTLDEIYGRTPRCTFCRLIYECTHSDAGQGIGHDGLDPDGNRVSCKIEWHLDSRTADARPTTRRLLVSNENGAFPEFYVVPAPESTTTPAGGTPVGRVMDKNAADLPLLAAWLESCQNDHTECSSHQTANHVPLTTDIRLIDVFDMTLRTFRPGDSPKYATLSYVWGASQQMRLLRENNNILQREGAVAEFQSRIPATVWDAFEVARQLCIPYIWIDALCIMQDDVEDSTRQIEVMDKIYQHAILTICVAAGQGSHSGIPGIGITPKNVLQPHEPYGDLLLTGMRPVARLIQDSTWDSRAWTFQERLLSTRCAIFTSAGIVWQCSTITWREDMASPFDHTLWSLDSVGSPLRALMGNPLRSYNSCVNIFSSRKLSFLSDKLKAFNGLGVVLGRKLDSEFIFGLPSRYFDWALLWEPERPGKRIIREWFQQDIGADLPSWSWCGWDHQVDWRLSTVGGPLFNLHEWLTERTWIIWRLGRNDSWELVHHSNAPPKDTPTYQANRWDGYGCGTATPYGRSEAAARCRHIPNVPDTELDCLDDGALETPKDGHLLFKTFTGHFTLSRKSMSKSTFQSALSPGMYRFGITDSSGDWCGSVILDKTWKNRVGAIFEFAAISDAKEFTLEELDTWTYYIPEERQQAEWYCFNAIMLQWQVGPDGKSLPVAERVGLAKIFQSSFFGRSFKPCEWKRIVLR
ncbi:heterokaryon incompatibility protein-domain-containing protein [Podospora conica]|nr:heterokaryon incompatibility protein-domain-containing protein [Schizothecium conicum]